MVRVQQAQDPLSGLFPVVTLKGLHVDAHGYALRRRAASCTSLWTRLSCLMNPPTKPMTITGGIVRARVGTDCVRPVWASATTAPMEKIEIRIKIQNRPIAV